MESVVVAVDPSSEPSCQTRLAGRLADRLIATDTDCVCLNHTQTEIGSDLPATRAPLNRFALHRPTCLAIYFISNHLFYLLLAHSTIQIRSIIVFTESKSIKLMTDAKAK